MVDLPLGSLGVFITTTASAILLARPEQLARQELLHAEVWTLGACPPTGGHRAKTPNDFACVIAR